ncbi:MAG: cache domain-containing protein [Paludibacterium sp.]|uniref:methyl-accepting chemotaxis protein n=1 Tax=Paludibacterium sp. TaxID=1917523 RepID=UPI0025EF80B4|nr:methyl-accepting chemotaxis protein [Paludibacterium sp.]MBV8047765.1 cache domain-containing protein [Paludibacterium sp.]MBV8648757.1 cache domain-containing protein [Paludibacterium sp.]
MKLSTRLAIIVASALLGLVLIACFALNTLDQSMVNERKAGIDTLLRLATQDIAHYQALERSGRLNREQAQAQAIEALRALRDGEDYLFVRRMDGFVLLHADKRKEGRIDDAGKMGDGRTGMQGYLDALAHSDSGFVELQVKKPGEDNFVPKINGVRHIADWDWIVGYGAYIDDISRLFWHQALQFVAIGALILLIVIALSMLQARRIYRRLGGEPDEAALAAAAIARGELNVTLTAGGAPDSLLHSMATMQHGLRTMVGDIGQDSATLQRAANDITRQMAHISDSANHTAEATASTAAAIEQMSVSIRQIADHAEETERNAAEASQLSDEGMRLVLAVAAEMRHTASEIGDAGTRIGALASRTDEIGGIANVIKEIADQTNLLALNAAIEAARAGEQGRGFAVVADEVRKLAERTAGATDQINQMIRVIQTDTHEVVSRMHDIAPQVDTSVDKAQRAAESLQRISEGAATALAQTREVAHSTAEQSTANASLASNVEQISHQVEEAARSAQATHDSVRALAQLSASLGVLVSKFKID